MVLRLTQEEINAHQNRVRRVPDRNTSTRAADESSPKAAVKVGNAPERALSQAAVRFTHYRRRAADADAFVGKWFLDAIVEAGLLPDDSPTHVTEVTHRQVIVEPWEDEKTVIELIPA